MKIRILFLLIILVPEVQAQVRTATTGRDSYSTAGAASNPVIETSESNISFDKEYFAPYRKPRNMGVAFRFGQVTPEGVMALPPSIDKEIEASFLGLDGFGAQPAYSLAVDAFITLNPKSKYVWIKIPVSLHGLVQSHTFDWSPINPSIEVDPLNYMGIGSGLMLNISIKNRFAISAYGKYSYIYFNSVPGIDHRSAPYRFRVYATETEMTGTMMTTGFDLQLLRSFSVFAEFNTMYIEQQYSFVEIFEGQFFDNVNYAIDFTSVIPYRSMTLGLALIINKK